MADLWKQVQRGTELLDIIRSACLEGLELLDPMAHVAASGGDGLAMVDRAWNQVLMPWEFWRSETILQQVPAQFGGKYQKGAYLLPLGSVPLRIQMPTLLPYAPTWPRAEYVEDARRGLLRTLESIRIHTIQVESARQEVELLV